LTHTVHEHRQVTMNWPISIGIVVTSSSAIAERPRCRLG